MVINEAPVIGSAILAGKDELALWSLRGAMLPQPFEHGRPEPHGPQAPSRLRLGADQALMHAHDLAPHREQARTQVDILPAKRDELAAAQAGLYRHVPERCERVAAFVGRA